MRFALYELRMLAVFWDFGSQETTLRPLKLETTSPARPPGPEANQDGAEPRVMTPWIWKHCPGRVCAGARETLKVVLAHRLHFRRC